MVFECDIDSVEKLKSSSVICLGLHNVCTNHVIRHDDNCTVINEYLDK